MSDSSIASSRPGHRALRRYRVSLPNRTYFLTACTLGRRPFFASSEAANAVFNTLLAEAEAGNFELIASVVMPDHLHAVVRLTMASDLQAIVRRVRSLAAREVNWLLGRNGQIWERGYFDHRLRLDEPLEDVLRYLWHNPIPAGKNFRCRRAVWTWFGGCIGSKPDALPWEMAHARVERVAGKPAPTGDLR